MGKVKKLGEWMVHKWLSSLDLNQKDGLMVFALVGLFMDTWQNLCTFQFVAYHHSFPLKQI